MKPSTPNDTPALMTHILHGINSGSCHGESFALAHFVRAPSPCKEMNCIPPARPPPHILAPSRSEPVAARTPPHFLAPSRSELVAECLRLNACFHRHTRTHTHTHTPDGNESMSDLFQQRHVVIRPLSPAFHISNWQRRQMKPNETK